MDYKAIKNSIIIGTSYGLSIYVLKVCFPLQSEQSLELLLPVILACIIYRKKILSDNPVKTEDYIEFFVFVLIMFGFVITKQYYFN